MSKKGINIFVRFRPNNEQEVQRGTQCVMIDPSQKEVEITVDGNAHRFNFRRIFEMQASQEQIYTSCGLPMIEHMLEGYNCAILAYGQTGGGKTYTLLGPGFDNMHSIGKADPEDRGLTPRMLATLFHDVYSNYDYSIYYTIYASYIQIYMESISDLINTAKQKLKIYQDVSKGLWVTDATKVPVKNADEVFNILQLGARNRITAATKSNLVSSRAHALLVLTVHKHNRDEGNFLAS
mmetsp:Transcript_29826/g.5386  ORF Transcript_29826/g.5386 Transcript_29826/m.5386 type:complete len:237 (+) Transcript_29826:236-946(+)